MAKRGKTCPYWSFGKLQTKLQRSRVADGLRDGLPGKHMASIAVAAKLLLNVAG